MKAIKAILVIAGLILLWIGLPYMTRGVGYVVTKDAVGGDGEYEAGEGYWAHPSVRYLGEGLLYVGAACVCGFLLDIVPDRKTKK